MIDPDAKPTTTATPTESSNTQGQGDARRPSDRLNKDEPSTEGTGAPVRKSSLL